MLHQFTLTYDEPLIRRAVLSFWRRTIGFGYYAALAIVAINLGLLLHTDSASWLIGFFAAFLIIGIAFIAMIYVAHYRNGMAKFRAMGDPTATFIAGDADFTMTSKAGSVTLPWSSVAELWQFPDCWLLLFSKAQFVTLRLGDIPPEARAFILDHVRMAGGKIG